MYDVPRSHCTPSLRTQVKVSYNCPSKKVHLQNFIKDKVLHKAATTRLGGLVLFFRTKARNSAMTKDISSSNGFHKAKTSAMVPQSTPASISTPSFQPIFI